jgi:hypothetical protein
MGGLSFDRGVKTETLKYGVKGSRKLVAHGDFFEWLFDPLSDQKMVKSARRVAAQLLVRGYAPNTKSVRGTAAGWQRAGLGGTGGSHDYLWYAQGGTALGRELGLSENEILLRFVRFHDDTDQPVPSTDRSRYLEIDSNDLLDPRSSEASSPLNVDQYRAALIQPHPITTIRGFPGSGKTTTLQYSASLGSAKSILYLTFNRRLADEARRYFDYFTPETSRVQVMSFEQFLEYLADTESGHVRLIPSNDGSTLMGQKLRVNPAVGLGDWKGHLDELYADFHAFGVGAALPFEFRGVAASTGYTVPKVEYKRNRVEMFGSASDMAATFLEQIADPATVFALFPGPFLSRSLLAAANEPPPPGFEEFDGIFVDEVQDLTLVELALIFNIGSRISVASGRMPHIVLAGDESQTVRPTNFGWSEVRDLAREFFPDVKFTDSVLTCNLRSPERIGKFVEASSNQYDLFKRSIRPRGQVPTLLDQQFPGHVIYCEVPDREAIKELLRIVEQTPRACLVYPGSRIPSDLSELDETGLIWTADDVKGLDFETTIVLDAGERQTALRGKLAVASNEIPNIWGRTLADQFRVCVSRSTSKLVLMDRKDHVSQFGHHAERLPALQNLIECSDDYPAILDFVDLEMELSREVDPEGLLNSIVEDLPQLRLRNPDRALRRIASGRRKVEEAKGFAPLSSEVMDRFLKESAISLAVIGFDRPPSDQRTALLDEAAHLFSATVLEESFARVRLLIEVLGKQRIDPRSVTRAFHELAETRDSVRSDLPELFERLERSITQWMNATIKLGPPNSTVELRHTVSNLNQAVEVLSGDLIQISAMRNSGLTDWGRNLLLAGKYSDSLIAIENLTAADDIRAGCLEGLGEFREAVDLYLRVDDNVSALRAARRGALLEMAMEVDDGSDPEISKTLRWLSEFDRLLRSTPPSLLDEERQMLLRRLEETNTHENF